MEEWLDISNYQGYQVSNLGRVRTHNKITHTEKHGNRYWKDKILKQKVTKNKRGRYDARIDLWSNGEYKTFLVSRLVAFTFYKKDLNNRKLTVNHIDGNSLNNNITNLELITLKENIEKGIELGLYDRCKKKVKLVYKKCERLIYCDSMAQASRILGYNKGYISENIKKNKFENKYAIWELIWR